MKSTSVYVYDCSVVSPMSLIFFGQELRVGEQQLSDGQVIETIDVDRFVKFNCAAKTSVVFKELRRYLDELLAYKVSNPGITDWDERKREGAVLRTIIDLLSLQPQGSEVENDDDNDASSSWSSQDHRRHR